jgi:hypothetical protein
MPSARQRAINLAADAAQLAADVRKQDGTARARRSREWQREKDKPARQDAADLAGCLINYVRACGYSPDVRPILLAAMHATHGEDRMVRVPDWLAGYYLDGGDAAELEQIARLPGKGTEKRTLAKAWRRAWDTLDAEQRRTGIVSLVRKPGGIDRDEGRKVVSEMHAVFVQRLVEIRSLAKTYRARRGERFERAAFEYVAGMERSPRNPSTKETRPRRIMQPETPALRIVQFINKFEKLADELLAAIPAEMHAEARAHIEATVRAKFEGEAGPVDHCIKSGLQNDDAAHLSAQGSWGSTHVRDREFRAENSGSGAIKVYKNGTQNAAYPPGDAPSEAEVHERVAVLIRGKLIGADEALDVKSKAHDPEARREFARRHMRPQIE